MHADDTNYTVVKNGVVVVSGTGPAIRVDGNRLVIRDGPQETPPLILTRAEASRKLRHVVVCGHAGGFVTFDALRWLRDTGVAFSQLDWNGAVIIASGPRGPDQPALRRAQALICSGVIPKAAVGIASEILRVKLRGQAEVAKLMGSADASAEIGSLAEAIACEDDGAKVLSAEARAASIYWKVWADIPVRFARRNPQRLGPKGRWRPGRPDPWLKFGHRTSILTGSPFRATTPGQTLLNFLYGILGSEMTVALLAAGLDPGIGMFHADVDRRSSLALDAIEAVRPYLDCWLFAYLACSAFANRDFAELADGEVRLTHPLSSHLAMTAAVWQKACQPVALWLAQSFGRATGIGAAPKVDDRAILVPGTFPQALPERGRSVPPVPAPLPAFFAPGRGHRPLSLRGGLKDDPVPRACHECGRALTPGGKTRFCSATCVSIYRAEMRRMIPVETGGAMPPEIAAAHAGEETRKRRITSSTAARLAWERAHQIEAPGKDDARSAAERAGLLQWYRAEIAPGVVGLRTVDVARALDISRVYARHIIRGEKMPHPRHFAALAKLAGAKAPEAL
jgi:CRISPR-associated endonuclease Cas1